MFIFIDGDSLVYKAAGAAQKKDPETKEVIVEPVEHAYANAKRTMIKILENTKANDYRFFLTGSSDDTNFRKLKYPLYKANRKLEDRPVHYYAVREYFINTWGAEVVYKIEADDAVIISYFSSDLEEKAVVGIDKDLENAPINLYNPDKDIWLQIDEFTALKHFWMQILEGDKSDNIPRIWKNWGNGVKKGEKKREQEVKRRLEIENENIDNIIKLIYNEFKRFYDDPKGEIQKRGELLWIMRKPEDYWEFNYEDK